MKNVLSYLFTFLLIVSTSVFSAYVDRNKAISMLKLKTAKDYPKSDNLYVSNDITDLDIHCTGTAISEEFYKILTKKAKKNNQIYFFYDTAYGSIKILNIEVIKKNGETIKYDPKKILHEKDNSFSGGSNIYSNTSKILTGELPNIEIGDIIYTKSKRFIDKSRMNDNYFDYFGIEDSSPYLNKFSKITLPSSKKLYIYDLNNHGFRYTKKVTTKGKKKEYTFNVKNTKVMVYEPNMEPSNFVYHHLKLTTVKDWKQISRWYHNLVKPHLAKTTKEMEITAKQLIKGAKTRKEKIGRVFYWVAQKIRYLGVDKEKNRPGYEPHDVSYTFNSRGGVCRDKAALLTAMLRMVNIKSDVILISSGSRLNYEAPMMWFNHAITVSYDKMGNPEYILDPTSETTKDFLPKYEEDNSYLIASKKGNTLLTTPVSLPKENNSTIDIDLKLDNKNNASGKFVFKFKGLSDTILRGWFSSLTDYEIKLAIQRFITKFNPNIELLEFTTTSPKDRSQDMQVVAKIKIEKFAQNVNGKLFIPFDATKLDMHILYNYMMGAFNISKRNYDFKMPGTFSFDINLNLTNYKAFKNVSFPEIDELNYKGFKTSLKSKIKGNRFAVNYHFESSKLHFKKEDFIALKKKLSSFDKYGNLYLIGKIGGESEK